MLGFTSFNPTYESCKLFAFAAVLRSLL